MCGMQIWGFSMVKATKPVSNSNVPVFISQLAIVQLSIAKSACFAKERINQTDGIAWKETIVTFFYLF